MNLNATFFIQLFHFLLGYILIERLLLRPWTNLIEDETKQQHEQERLLKIAQNRVALKEQFKEEQWREFQIKFAQSMPPLIVEAPHITMPTEQAPIRMVPHDSHALNSCKKEVIKTLIARLSHE